MPFCFFQKIFSPTQRFRAARWMFDRKSPHWPEDSKTRNYQHIQGVLFCKYSVHQNITQEIKDLKKDFSKASSMQMVQVTQPLHPFDHFLSILPPVPGPTKKLENCQSRYCGFYPGAFEHSRCWGQCTDSTSCQNRASTIPGYHRHFALRWVHQYWIWIPSCTSSSARVPTSLHQ